MTAQLLAGAPVADAVLAEVRVRVAALARKGITPGLGTILVGDDGASAGYVRKKHETCEQVGLNSFHLGLSAADGQHALMGAVAQFNRDPAVHAYIVQLPVPPGFDANAALLAMDPAKDADGLHPVNLGRLVLQEEGPVPCTPAGIQAILVHYGMREIAGRRLLGVSKLMDVAAIRPPIAAEHIGFRLGPRLNAAGRLTTRFIEEHFKPAMLDPTQWAPYRVASGRSPGSTGSVTATASA